ncbi:MAG: hypothetical protein ABW321_16170, partial [Polyangiales bacterium]
GPRWPLVGNWGRRAMQLLAARSLDDALPALGRRHAGAARPAGTGREASMAWSTGLKASADAAVGGNIFNECSYRAVRRRFARTRATEAPMARPRTEASADAAVGGDMSSNRSDHILRTRLCARARAAEASMA